MTATTDRRSPAAFFALVVALSAPVYVASALVHVDGLPKNMPVFDALLAFVPLVAAAILTYRTDGAAGVARLLNRAVDAARLNRRWVAVVVLLGPCTLLVTYALTRPLDLPLPEQPRLSVAAMLVLPFAFLLAAAGEELGWTGYATGPLTRRWTALGGALILGTFWWAWHLPSIVQSGQPPLLIALGALAGIAGRVVWVWIYLNSGRSVFAIVVVHAVANVTASYVPSVPTGLTGPVTAVIAVVVVAVWGPRTLRRRLRP